MTDMKIETMRVRDVGGNLRVVARVLVPGRADGPSNYCIVAHVTPEFGGESAAIAAATDWAARACPPPNS